MGTGWKCRVDSVAKEPRSALPVQDKVTRSVKCAPIRPGLEEGSEAVGMTAIGARRSFSDRARPRPNAVGAGRCCLTNSCPRMRIRPHQPDASPVAQDFVAITVRSGLATM